MKRGVPGFQPEWFARRLAPRSLVCSTARHIADVLA